MDAIKNVIELPKTSSLESYKQAVDKNILQVFSLEGDEKKQIPYKEFVANIDHGMEHTFNVYKKSLEIAKTVAEKTGESIDSSLLFVMSGMHDSGRFRVAIPNDSDTELQKKAKEKKRITAERQHGFYGVAQVRLAVKKLKSERIDLDDDQIKKIEDYILNHDFFNTRLDGEKYKEPSSLEGQVVRLGDRVSVPVEEEIERYWETGKRLNTPYFKKDISFEERIQFSFSNMGSYIKSGKFDEFTFFLALLSMSKNDFSHPVLQDIYQNWSTTKKKGIEKILHIASDEGYSKEDIAVMKDLITQYLENFDIVL